MTLVAQEQPESRITLRHVDDVLVVAFHGQYGISEHRAMRRAVKEALMLRPARAIVADMRSAWESATPIDLIQVIADAETDPNPVREPIALVVSERALDRVRVMCSHAWAIGRFWAPFLTVDQAADWAARRRHHPSRQTRPAEL